MRCFCQRSRSVVFCVFPPITNEYILANFQAFIDIFFPGPPFTPFTSFNNWGKNYIKDDNQSRSSNISKDSTDSTDDVQIKLNKDEEAALILELDEKEKNIKKSANIKKKK